MHLCLLSITYACPYHNPTATMGHSIHNIDISKPLTHTTPHMRSAICPVQWKPGFICEENTSPKCQTPSNVSICPLKSVTMTNCSQFETPMKTTSIKMSFPETVSDSLCRNSLVMQTDCCSSCPGGWSRSWRWKCWMWRSWVGVVTRYTSASWYATPVRWMDYLSKGEVLTNTDLDKFVNNIWEK